MPRDTRPYAEVIESLPAPDDDAIITQADAVLYFQGEAWVNGHARAVDDGGAEFTVPLADLRTPDGEWAIEDGATSHYVSDQLRTHEAAPDWVRDWQGPFTVSLADWRLPDSATPPWDGETAPSWVDRHSVTCAICGGYADERRTVNLLANITDERPTLADEQPLRALAIATAVNEYGEGEAHEDCLEALTAHLLEYGARLSAAFDRDPQWHR